MKGITILRIGYWAGAIGVFRVGRCFRIFLSPVGICENEERVTPEGGP